MDQVVPWKELYNCCNNSSRIIRSIGHAGRPPLLSVQAKSVIDHRCDRGKVDVLLQQLQRIAQLLTLGFAFGPANRLIIGLKPNTSVQL